MGQAPFSQALKKMKPLTCATNVRQLNASEWGKNGFSNLENLEAQGYNQNSRAGSIAASDDVNHCSSPDRSSLDGRLAEFNNAEAEGDDGPFVDPSPVPDMDDTDIANTVLFNTTSTTLWVPTRCITK